MKCRLNYDFRIIGENLRRLRIENNFSVEEVREYMQMGTVQSIYKWERGAGLPPADSLIALLQFYKVKDISELIREDIFNEKNS